MRKYVTGGAQCAPPPPGQIGLKEEAGGLEEEVDEERVWRLEKSPKAPQE